MTEKKKRKPPVMQTDVPSMELAQALRIPQAIADNYAMNPTAPLDVAAAVEMQPSSGPFRMLCGAAQAYGLTEGGYNAQHIALTERARRILRPQAEGAAEAAMREAFQQPRVIGEFLRKYDGSPVPRDDIAVNVLEGMEVPRERAADVFAMIIDGARRYQMLRTIKGRDYVSLNSTQPSAAAAGGAPPPVDPAGDDPEESIALQTPGEEIPSELEDVPGGRAKDESVDKRRKRVFVTHGKNRAFLEPIKKLLSFGELEPVISIEKSTSSKPVPEKVLADMRSCGAAIIHVDADRKVIDETATEHILINENVLIEIGAAMALYGRRFILLVAQGISLPSNLQGLFRVDYAGSALDGDATIRLL